MSRFLAPLLLIAVLALLPASASAFTRADVSLVPKGHTIDQRGFTLKATCEAACTLAPDDNLTAGVTLIVGKDRYGYDQEVMGAPPLAPKGSKHLAAGKPGVFNFRFSPQTQAQIAATLAAHHDVRVTARLSNSSDTAGGSVTATLHRAKRFKTRVNSGNEDVDLIAPLVPFVDGLYYRVSAYGVQKTTWSTNVHDESGCQSGGYSYSTGSGKQTIKFTGKKAVTARVMVGSGDVSLVSPTKDYPLHIPTQFDVDRTGQLSEGVAGNCGGSSGGGGQGGGGNNDCGTRSLTGTLDVAYGAPQLRLARNPLEAFGDEVVRQYDNCPYQGFTGAVSELDLLSAVDQIAESRINAKKPPRQKTIVIARNTATRSKGGTTSKTNVTYYLTLKRQVK